MRLRRTFAATILCVALSGAGPAALDRITASNLRGEVTYLASDDLQGRLTPSPGLDRAAEFIAWHFQKDGLDRPASGTYFQTAGFLRITVPRADVHLQLHDGVASPDIPAARMTVRAAAALDLSDAPLRRLPANGIIPDVADSIVIGDEDRWGDETLLGELTARQPRLILLVNRNFNARSANSGANSGNDDRRPPDTSFLEEAAVPHIPIIRIRDSEALRLLRSTRDLTLTLHLPEPRREPVTLRNVVGLLRGSDPTLSHQYILLTAHYDHLGSNSRGIFHGANDNASGTASVVEIATALAALPQHPKRSILFMAFFGEEEDLLGSYYYASHPLFPLKDTIADVNLEQMGRTDERSGKQIGAFAISGPSYSSLPAILADSAKAEGIAMWRPRDADDYFNRSDNYAFAQHGVIAHTLAVAFEFPDYHRPTDTADKLDYDNMARVDRAIAAGILRLATDAATPQWSDSPAAGPWREAGR